MTATPPTSLTVSHVWSAAFIPASSVGFAAALPCACLVSDPCHLCSSQVALLDYSKAACPAKADACLRLEPRGELAKHQGMLPPNCFAISGLRFVSIPSFSFNRRHVALRKMPHLHIFVNVENKIGCETSPVLTFSSLPEQLHFRNFTIVQSFASSPLKLRLSKSVQACPRKFTF